MPIYTGFLTRVTIWDDVALDVTDPDVRLAMLENPGDELGNNIVDFYGEPEIWNAGANQGSGGDFIMTGEVDIGVRFLDGTLFVDPDLFHGGVITTGPVTITGTLFVDPDLFHSGKITTLTTITGTLFVDPDLFHGGEVSAGTTLSGTLFVDPDLFHGGVVTPGVITLTGTLFVDPDLFHGGTIAVDIGEQVLVGTLYVDPDLFHGGVVTPGVVTLAGTLFVDPDLFHGGEITLVGGERDLDDVLNDSDDAFQWWPVESATVFQDTPGTVPALNTDPVREVTNFFTGGLQEVTEAVAPSDAARGQLTVGGTTFIKLDRVDDIYNFILPAGGWTGNFAFGSDVLTVSGTFTETGTLTFPSSTNRFPGNDFYGVIYTDGTVQNDDGDIMFDALVALGSAATIQGTTLLNFFRGWDYLTSLDVTDWDVSAITDIFRTFEGCLLLDVLDVSEWNTALMTGFESAFSNNSAAILRDVTNWNVSNSTSFLSMFNNCNSMTTCPVGLWTTTSILTVEDMFNLCGALLVVDVSNWVMTNVTSIANFCRSCSSITTLDISNWSLGTALTGAASMCRDCTSLASVTVGTAFQNAVNCVNYNDTFRNCALDVASVNAIIIDIEAAGTNGGLLGIHQGTNAAPTGAGATAVTSLESRGWIVETN